MMKKLIELGASIDAAICAADEYDGGYNFERDMKIRDALMALPTVDAVPVRHGRWNSSDDVYETAVCSVCRWDTTEPWVHIKEWFNFCPHCGADMRKDGDHYG